MFRLLFFGYYFVRSLNVKNPSAYIESGLWYIIFPFLLLTQVFVYVEDVEFLTDENRRLIFLVSGILGVLSVYVGAQNFLKVRNKIESIQKQLKLL